MTRATQSRSNCRRPAVANAHPASRPRPRPPRKEPARSDRPSRLPSSRAGVEFRVARTRASDRDSALFAVAAGVIALHATVDAFVAPEPGTQWSDHLLRGFATLAILAAAVALVPRLAAGARAAVAAALGVLALEGAGLAVADTRAVGARGEDWTGFLLAPVGLSLCGLAAVLLWRSRKLGRLRYLRRAGHSLRQHPRGLLDRLAASPWRSSRRIARGQLSSRWTWDVRMNT